MFTESVRSIQSGLLYSLFCNARNSSTFKQLIKAVVVCNYQSQQRSYCYRTTDNYLQTKSIVNNFCVISHRSASQSSNLKRMFNYLPFFASGEIVSGFGRGSKELGIPTANYPLDVVKSLPESFQPGVYFGWANVNNGPVYKMVMSIGWNPFYDNKEKSMETHILHNFNRDLYGCLLKVCIVGYLRQEKNFKSLEDLVACIKHDIAQAEDVLETNETYKTLQNHQFFIENCSVSNDNHKNDTGSKNVGS